MITFPAAALRAFWEHCLLKIMKEPVEGTAYLSLNELCGHVEHRLLAGAGRNLLFCALPGLLNLILAVPLVMADAGNLFILGAGMRNLQTGLISPLFFVYILFYWLGASLLCNLFPLYEDAMHLLDVSSNAKGIKKVPLWALARVIYAGAFLERHGINVLIAAMVTVTAYILK